MFTCAKSRTNFRYFNIMNNDFGKESDGLPMQTVVICFSLYNRQNEMRAV
mgnify:CR=1 FL=1